MGARPFSPRRHAAADPAMAEASVASDSPVRLSGRGREAAALLLFAVSCFLCLALASYRLDPNDPTVSGSDWVGPVGAFVAGVLVRAFGLVAWVVPLEVALIGLPLLRRKDIGSASLRVAGDLVLAIVLASLTRVALPELLVFGRVPSGGNVGLVFGELARGLFSSLGSFLVGGTIVGLILIGRSSFSFIALVQRVVALAQLFSSRAQNASRRFGGAWAEAHRLREEQRAQRREAAAPQITSHETDEAIIAQLVDDDVFVPPEMTGTPPIAISTALRAAAPESAEEILFQASPASASDLEQAPVAPAPVAPPTTPTPELGAVAFQAVEALDRAPDTGAAVEGAEAEVAEESDAPVVRKSSRAKAKSDELVIIDTKPAQAVKRGSGPSPRTAHGYTFPTPSLLLPPSHVQTEVDREHIRHNAALLEKTLGDYGVTARVEEVHPGPTVTMYEVAPEAGTKVSKVASLVDDLALGLSRTVRIVAPIPGKNRIGFEIPNDERIPVNLRELIEDKHFAKLAEKAPLPVVLGRDIVGVPFYADLASMPHVIVAGATGAGKSVGLNVMLSSLLFCRSPAELRFLMIDPKVVELAPFDGIPHMLLPVVTDMKKAATALKWAVDEMERRYQLFANAGTKNISTYNGWVKRVVSGEAPLPPPEEVQALAPDGSMVSVAAAKQGTDGKHLPHALPYIVIVVDEFADLMMQQGKEVEVSVARLAQKARAAGMHVVLATQRPSVDVITGMIKANFPSRIGFRVAQKVDSRTILDEQGAELLLGKGDMLVKLNGSTDTRRVQCPFVSEEEVAALTEFVRRQGAPEYHDEILAAVEEDSADASPEEQTDARFDEAVNVVRETQRCSTSWLQRKMTIGYNRAAKIVEMMERRGLVGPPNGAKDREVLMPPG
ncbi:MAG: DNA translocase FtsK [Myxococcales bacterium]|nr:DNA translocase FtsK [Myxococcales bacterium]